MDPQQKIKPPKQQKRWKMKPSHSSTTHVEESMIEFERNTAYEVVGGTNAAEFPDVNKSLSLEELVDNYSNLLPFNIKINAGFLAENELDPTLGVDEIYNVHLVKQSQMVVIFSANGEEYTIPVNSASKFGLVYNPHLGTDVVPQEFETVEDVIEADPLPRVVAVQSKYVPQDNKYSLLKNEVLIVRGVIKAKFVNSSLRMFSILKSTDMILPTECHAGFTTDPLLTKVFLSELLENISLLLPCSARMYPSADKKNLPKSLTSRIITLDSQHTNKSVVVSLFRDNPDGERKTRTTFIDIPTSIGISVSILKPDKSSSIYERLCDQTHSLISDYSSTKIQACVDARTDKIYMTQAQLLAEIRAGKEKDGLAIAAGDVISKSTTQQQYQPLVMSQREPVHNYEEVSIPIIPKIQENTTVQEPPRVKVPPIPSKQSDYLKRAPILPPTSNSTKKGVTILPAAVSPDGKSTATASPLKDVAVSQNQAPAIKSKPSVPYKKKLPRPVPPQNVAENTTNAGVSSEQTITVGSGMPNALPAKGNKKPNATSVDYMEPKGSEYSDSPGSMLSHQLSELRNSVANLTLQINKITSIEARLDTIEDRLDQLATTDHAGTKAMISSGSIPADRMNIAHIQNMLDELNLQQYKATFKRESVSGDVLVELDEETLAEELGVHSKIHRVRILKAVQQS